MKAMLDTNVYSALMRGDLRVAEHVRRCTCLYMSATVVGELLYGFRNGSRYQSNRDQLNQFLATLYVEFVPITMTTCERFALVAAALRKNENPIPGNDIWIAAHALETGADLFSFDTHFAAVDGLSFVQFQP